MSEDQDAVRAAIEIINNYKEDENASRDLSRELENITTFPQRLKDLGFTTVLSKESLLGQTHLKTKKEIK